MSSNPKEIIIRNERVIDFYNKHNMIDIEQVNLLYIELFEKIMSSSFDNNSLINNIMGSLSSQNNEIIKLRGLMNTYNETTRSETENIKNIYLLSVDNLKQEIEQLKSSLQSINLNLINKIYETKDMYIKEVKDNIKASEDASLLSLLSIIEKQNNNLSDKLVYHINETVPKTQIKQYEDLIDIFKKDMLLSLNSLNELKNNDPNIILEKLSTIIDSKYNTLLSNIQDNILNNISQTENRLNINLSQIKDLSHKGSIIQETISDHLIKVKTCVNKGTHGEKKLFNIINEEYPSGELINSSNNKGQGDMILKRVNKPTILIETKEYVTPVKKDEVDKFIRDISNVNHNGIFISHHSGVVGKENYQIDIHDKNILIYIHNCEYEPYKIRCAINMIDILHEKLINIDNKNTTISLDLLKEINTEYQSFILQKEKMLNGLKDYYKRTLDQYSELNLPSLDKYISSYYANSKKNILCCNICNKYETDNLKSLSRHKTSCKKKAVNNTDNSNTSEEKVV